MATFVTRSGCRLARMCRRQPVPTRWQMPFAVAPHELVGLLRARDAVDWDSIWAQMHPVPGLGDPLGPWMPPTLPIVLPPMVPVPEEIGDDMELDIVPVQAKAGQTKKRFRGYSHRSRRRRVGFPAGGKARRRNAQKNYLH
eukprot:CAMPEP_0204358666 /NCGR_PEP_ID=MMETSP0469-20131031/36692_1 /ASSEMBLY_ACC=CAM_ASM_000384 /TAXON_ID=2969 /ORGANISM="Oxyrrhis marina" /LENGTH=140 /DNA_ID=CAMNT_0051346575 /DNA_START=6 /DNA_END=428 /DNA_ORIENTATION=+